MASTIAVITARNEEEHIARTITALQSQTHPISEIIVVDDGSIDQTGKIAKEYGCTCINLPFHKKSYVGRPELTEVWNIGLKTAETAQPDYVLLVGADHALEPDYLEKLLGLVHGTNIVVSSGDYIGDPRKSTSPGGSGRLVDASWWKKLNGMRYPVNWGWEGWLLYAAQFGGYEVKCFPQLKTKLNRQIKMSMKKSYYWGKGTYCLHSDPLFAIFRCIRMGARNPLHGLAMFAGYVLHRNCKRYIDFSSEFQAKRQQQAMKAALRQLVGIK